MRPTLPLLAAIVAGCLDHDPIPGGAGESFVAMQADFDGYRTWTDHTVEPEDTGHPDGARTVYINTAPDGGTTFPVGTVIVKEIVGGDIHAMAKRGGGFNPDGAIGWEWFELVTATDGSPVIKWRGTEAPEGEAYGQLPGSAPEDTGDAVTGDCNTCHGAAVGNDYVHAIPLGG
ncbi:MAG: hypothetical protein ACK4YP_06610 [Myxococcota bacterium]